MSHLDETTKIIARRADETREFLTGLPHGEKGCVRDEFSQELAVLYDTLSRLAKLDSTLNWSAK